MNKAAAIIFLATFAIIGLSEIEASKESKFLFRPRPWIPLNIPIPRPATSTPACPAQTDGCTKCDTTPDVKACTSGGDGTPAKCYDADTCKAPCTCTPACDKTCKPA